MKKCAICNKEINGGLLVEKECLEKLQAENAELRERNAVLLAIVKADVENAKSK